MSYIQTKKEEKLNAFTHAFGAFLSIIGIIAFTINYDSTTIRLCYLLLYGFSMFFLYASSTLYHAVEKNTHKKALRKLDHISIYFLIAGTYTPICVSILKNSYGEVILGIVWGITFLGLILKLFFTGKFEKISLLLYLIMGWIIVIDFSTLYHAISLSELIYLVLGGAFYTVGVVFYVMHKLKYHHVIWHVFVLFGSLFHFLLIYSIVT